MSLRKKEKYSNALRKKLKNYIAIQSTLGFTTRGLAANLDLATGRAVTELCQYLNSDLVFSDLKFLPLCSEIATVKVVIPSGPTAYPANCF